MFDIRYQYALHTISFKEQPIFKNRLINSTVSRLIKVIDKNTTIPESFKPYLGESHYNDTIYHARDIQKSQAKGLKMIPINLVGDGNTGKESKRQDIMRGKNEAKRKYLNSRR